MHTSLPAAYLCQTNQALQLTRGYGTRTMKTGFGTHVHVKFLEGRGGRGGYTWMDVLQGRNECEDDQSHPADKERTLSHVACQAVRGVA